MYHLLKIICFTLVVVNCLYAQLTVDVTLSDTVLAQSLASNGVVISNITSSCADSGMGSFNAVGTDLGIDSGLILSTGYALNAIGADSGRNSGCDAFGGWLYSDFRGLPGDSHLENLFLEVEGENVITNDACSIEFDIISSSNGIEFNYVFASEEYLEYVNLGVFDVFGFFINGPGIEDSLGNLDTVNLAWVPNTEQLVHIDNINDNVNSQYYNGHCPDSNDSTFMEYDGFTSIFTAAIDVVACATYHLKLVIADVGDWALDSGVLIEANSLAPKGGTNFVEIIQHPIEGCLDGIVRFKRFNDLNDSLLVSYTKSGQAIEGDDYLSFPDSIYFLPGDSFVDLNIKTIADTIMENGENITISTIYGNCLGFVTLYDLFIFEELNLKDSIILCPFVDSLLGPLVQDQFIDSFTYLWSPSNHLSNDSVNAPNFINTFSDTSFSYKVVMEDTITGCRVEDSIQVNIRPLINTIEMIDSLMLCPKVDSLVGPVIELLSQDSFYYNWVPSNLVDQATLNSPLFINDFSDTILKLMVEVTDTSTGCIIMDSLIINVLPNIDVLELLDTLEICAGVDTFLGPAILDEYSDSLDVFWQPNLLLDSITNNRPRFLSNVSDSIVEYFVTVFDPTNGCQFEDSQVVMIRPEVEVFAGVDQVICRDDTNKVLIGSNSSESGAQYTWSPMDWLQSVNTPSTLVYYTGGQDVFEEDYVITKVDSFGCIGTDTASVKILDSVRISINPTYALVRSGGEVRLAASGGHNYTWLPNKFLSCDNCSDPIATPTENITYIVTASKEGVCFKSDSVRIEMLNEFPVLPTAFTPGNNENGNGTFFPIVNYFIGEVEFKVYDRWGNCIFVSQDVNEGWDGSWNGVEQEVGAYRYYLKATKNDGSEVLLEGTVTLVR